MALSNDQSVFNEAMCLDIGDSTFKGEGIRPKLSSGCHYLLDDAAKPFPYAEDLISSITYLQSEAMMISCS